MRKTRRTRRADKTLYIVDVAIAGGIEGAKRNKLDVRLVLAASRRLYALPGSNSMALRVSGLKPEYSSAISNPWERICANIVSAFERFRSSKMRASLDRGVRRSRRCSGTADENFGGMPVEH
jgi:hypothetical protein